MKKNEEQKIREEFLRLCMEDLKGGIHYSSAQSSGFKKDMNGIADYFISIIKASDLKRKS